MNLMRFASPLLIVVLLVSFVLSGCVPLATAPAPQPSQAEATPAQALAVTHPPETTRAPEPTTAPTAVPTLPPVVPGKNELVYGLTLVVSGIDPHIHSSSELGIPLTSVYDTLVYQGADYKYIPGLAESWTISDDARTYTFKLRQGVKFHDGTPFNAQAVKENFDRIVDPATKSQKAINLMGTYKGCEVVDEYTVKVHFDTPNVSFLNSVAQVYLGMASPTAFRKWGPAEYQAHQVGTGPFIFSEQDYIPKQQIVLVKNPDYNWGPSLYQHTGPAYLDKITFRFYPDPATRAAALESGGVDVIGELPPVDAERLQKDARYQVIPVRTDGVPLVFFINTAKAPTDDLRVRQALLYATDRKAIVKTIFRDLSPVAYGPWAGLGFNQDLEALYPYDLNKAQQLLDEAGWQPGADGIRVKDGEKLVLETYLQTWGFLSEVGQMLQAQLKMAGVELKIQTVSFPAALQAAAEGKHHLAPMSLSATDPSFLNAILGTRGNFNWSKLNDPEINRMLDEAAQTLDEAKRLDLYKKIQRAAMEQALVIPIREYWNMNGASARVKGLVFGVHGWWPYLYDVKVER